MNYPSVELLYDSSVWRELQSEPKRTFQVFITNRCNLRCNGCFYSAKLGHDDMAIDRYADIVEEAASRGIRKVTILGGEPSIHPMLPTFVGLNQSLGIDTTIYTNGANLQRVLELSAVVRVGVHGLDDCNKPLTRLRWTDRSFTLVYMLDRRNAANLWPAVLYTAKHFPSVRDLYLSSIRDVATTGSFWLDTPDTMPNHHYAAFVQDFLDRWKADDLPIRRLHIATRGVLTSPGVQPCEGCRFENHYPDGAMTRCPMDISLGVTDQDRGERLCSKSPHGCVLRKILLERR